MTEPTANVTLKIGGMHCPACSNRVLKALTAVPGVKKAEVSLDPGQADVSYDPGETTLAELRQAVSEAGYTCEGVA